MMRIHHRKTHTKPCRGFTLIEVVTSLSIMSVLMLGLSGAVMISSHAIPTTTDTGLMDQSVIDTLNQLRGELREAVSVKYNTRSGGSTIEIVIKNSGVAGAPGKILYTYTSASGSLTRKVDALATTTLFTGIEAFVVSLTDDGANISVVQLLISVKGTIQHFFEMHALLPNHPGIL